MTSVLSKRLTEIVSDIQSLSEVISKLEAERDYYKQLATTFAEAVDRQGLNYAERIQLESFEGKQ